jgi:signal transduction histidine kinase
LPFQDLRFRQGEQGCDEDIFRLNGVPVHMEVLSINGQRWVLSFVSSNPTSFYVFLWITRIAVIACVFLVSLSLRRKHLWDVSKREIETRHAVELGRQAVQVAHDIRSPLAVLSQVGRDEDVYERALGRLKELAGHLLGESPPGALPSGSLATLISDTVEEKLAEYPGELAVSTDIGCADISVPGDVFLWRRMLSNLLNNAIEASLGEQRAKLSLSFSASEGIGTLFIRDFGRGIPAGLLPEIGKRGGSYGKDGGKGLGVSSAIRFMESIGGKFSLDSTEGVGTTVSLEFPLSSQEEVVLVDDDKLLADIWARAAARKNIPFSYFENPEALLQGIGRISKSAFIYLDVNFESQDVDVNVFGKIAHEQGFQNLFLATGYPISKFNGWGWVRDVVGKEPPFV